MSINKVNKPLDVAQVAQSSTVEKKSNAKNQLDVKIHVQKKIINETPFQAEVKSLKSKNIIATPAQPKTKSLKKKPIIRISNQTKIRSSHNKKVKGIISKKLEKAPSKRKKDVDLGILASVIKSGISKITPKHAAKVNKVVDGIRYASEWAIKNQETIKKAAKTGYSVIKTLGSIFAKARAKNGTK